MKLRIHFTIKNVVLESSPADTLYSQARYWRSIWRLTVQCVSLQDQVTFSGRLVRPRKFCIPVTRDPGRPIHDMEITITRVRAHIDTRS